MPDDPFAGHVWSLVAHKNLTLTGNECGLGVVTIAACTIRLPHVDAADSDVFHGAKSSNMLFPHRFSWV